MQRHGGPRWRRPRWPTADTVVTAVVGMCGPASRRWRPSGREKRIALANKETLVCAGELVMAEAERYGAEIVPVDSEHSAIFQCLQGCRDRGEVKRLLLTCSGGPFFGRTSAELEHMTSGGRPDSTPTGPWGPKITVDSATLMNKGLEVIEAMRLYRLPLAQVDVVIHRQSIIHSLVEYRDGAMIAQLGTPDMQPAHPLRPDLARPGRRARHKPLDLLSLRAADLRRTGSGGVPLPAPG